MEEVKIAVCNGLKKNEKLAPRARFELATLRLTADDVKNPNALSGVAYTNSEVTLALLAAPNSAPKFWC
jgi:hypothetical protein